ncbi:alanyl-tRNA synthetase [Wolbachia endosymbiont of Armadillidium vulgare str. wVulC]|uniref:alanine--tRNA ligase n=1 Tax=Wolbachia endosymbiont of Armadillidium vulgare TaxID=77039 RepID=UPI00064A045F|nr:alanine--tRNA ligase [Wolbachia endosymbiont of Armadillidium vulgare]KLT23084.1 alanyl-tRNA synthetase [Wolbachia endosymbiont of Armadillidium vulgare str. wVulC]OJH31264.1 Alanine--tRNA ligase [Wolbachia endosymbiont of Armadillidium vulgare]OJH32425.1 Alanine--tRNA ligase [Wolbachia endosymbiont of Armadillidium vulgare]
MKLNEIRERFIKFFVNNNHEQVPSSPLIPEHDPTLMFTNAGMVQFKNIFTGAQKTEMKRAVSSQKCLRAGGKHNDLENVGYTTRHHTFFEMLGNFSFGDYFKETAIELAWKFITEELPLDKNRLSITVYHTDDEAYEIWHKISGFSDDKIIRIATDDNFWSMGNAGPCGPCSEIFYDYGSPDLHEDDGIIEIWNLVFMEFNKDEKGNLQKLPKKCIDTGMGLERIAAVMQKVHDNYDIDLFSALVSKSQEYCGNKENKVAHKIITDHLRAAAFLIAEGVLPGNEGRNYVLRRLIRRAARYIHLLGYNDSLLHLVFPALIDGTNLAYMGDVYPELIRAKSLIETTLKSEEENFKDTLMKGINLLDKFTADLKSGDTLPGESAFKLYDTYGFPLDITLDILKERKINFDQKGFDNAMKEQKERARANWSGSGEKSVEQVWFNLIDQFGKTEFVGYERDEVKDAKVLAIISPKNEMIDSVKEGEKITVILDKTPFYGESGGQVGDTGSIIKSDKSIITVENTNKINDLYLHRCIVRSGSVRKGDTVTASIDKERRQNLKRNHSVTHLLHFALRQILGDHVTQKGSLVAPNRLRFDFSHSMPVTQDQLFSVEDTVNSLIRENLSTSTKIQGMDQAIDEGAMALFGEKYGDKVRVIKIGDSKELCGGTHVERTGEIGLFKIAAECSVASGVRRIEALTDQEAINYVRNNEISLKKVAESVKAPVNEIISRLSILSQERKEFEIKIKNLYKKLVSVENIKSTEINGINFVSHTFNDVPVSIIREFVLQQQKPKTVIAFTVTEKDKTVLIVKVSKDLTDKINAKELVSTVTERDCGGNAELAQIGCDSNKIDDAITAIYSKITAYKDYYR